MNFNINPSLSQLEEIKIWLIEEDVNSNKGFYCNWKNIEDSFKNKQLFVLELEQTTIGFITWSIYENKYAEIHMMEIKASYRQKGLGKIFYEKTEDYFKSKELVAIELYCSPKESETFWLKRMYIKFPHIGYSESELTYYKPLIETQKQNDQKGLNNKLELWDLEPYQIRNQEPKWTWELINKYPILQPCNYNWNLRLTKNGKIIQEDKVKRFDSNKEITIGSFLFIEIIE